MTKRDFLLYLVMFSPLILLMNFLPFINSVNPKLSLGVGFEIIGFLFLTYRKGFTELNLRTKKENLEGWKRAYTFRLVLVSTSFVLIGLFLLYSYLSEVLKK